MFGDAVRLPLDLPLMFQLHLAFPRRVQLGLPFLGLAALAQCGGTIGEGVPVDLSRCRPAASREKDVIIINVIIIDVRTALRGLRKLRRE